MDKEQKEPQLLTREERLTKWFRGNPQTWRDLRSEFDECMDNSIEQLKAVNCDSREFHAGECSGLELAKNLPFPFTPRSASGRPG